MLRTPTTTLTHRTCMPATPANTWAKVAGDTLTWVAELLMGPLTDTLQQFDDALLPLDDDVASHQPSVGPRRPLVTC